MTGSITTAGVKASVDVRPVRSQVFLVAVTVVAGISVICGALLIAASDVSGWGFLLFAIILIGGGFKAWTKSQSDVDLHESHPTRLALSDGTMLTTDSRTLRSPEGIQAFAQLFQEVLCRRPLPAPDGLVDDSTRVIPDSKDAALALTNKINNTTQATTNALVDALGLADKAPPNVIQQIIGAQDKGPDVALPQNLNALISN